MRNDYPGHVFLAVCLIIRRKIGLVRLGKVGLDWD